MSFLLVDTSRYQQDQILHTLKEKFNTPTKLVTSLPDAMDFLNSQNRTISAVIFNTTELRETLVPILQHLAANSPLTATLLITSLKVKHSILQIQKEYPYLDHYCYKPMHNYGLVEALIVAHQKRLQKNNSVFLLSNTPFREVLPGINVIRLDALDKAFGKKPFRGIFLDSPSLSVESAQRIKKSLRNTVVPIGLYGTENEAAWVLSDLATDVYRETESLEKCIQQFADASGNFLFRALMTSRLKSAQTDGRNKDTLQISQELETLQPRCSLSFSYRGHALEKMNLKEEAIEAYLKAIEVNPFHPENYLRLIEIVPNSDSILLKAKQYCPRHPQIVSQLKLHELKISSLK